MTSETRYAIRLRERGEARHRLLGVKCLTNRWLRAVSLETVEDARLAARWLLDHNTSPDGFDSAQVVEFGTGRVVERLA